MKKKILISMFFAAVAAIAVIAVSCQKEKHPDEELSVAIASSSEMEEYIVSGYELQAAAKEFEKALNQVDWSKLSFVKDEDGREVMRLPVQSLNFETKLRQFNGRKGALQKRYPQVVSMPLETCSHIIRSCVQRSETVSAKLLDMGINVFQPMTKIRPEGFEDGMDFLDGWMGTPNYVEAMMVVYRDGSSAIYVDPSNTYNQSHISLEHRGGLYYYPQGGSSSPILFLAHTHQSGPNPSPEDYASAGQTPGLMEAIYYNGNLYGYDASGRH